MIQILKNSLTTKYFQFAGRANRKEYWILYLLGYIAGYIVFFIIKNNDILGLKIVCLSLFILFFIFIPSISVSVRRLHDFNFSGWWFLLFYSICFFIADQMILIIISFLINNILGIIKGTPTTNKYGEPPTY